VGLNGLAPSRTFLQNQSAMNCNIFDTEEEARLAQEADFKEFASSISNSAYLSVTKAWAEVRQRATDGKWYYISCPSASGAYCTEEYDESWSEIEE